MYRRPEAILFDVDGVFRTVPLKFIHHAHMEAVREMVPDHRLDRHYRIVTELRGTPAFVNESRDFIELLGHVALEGKKAGQVLKTLHEQRQDTTALQRILEQYRKANGTPENLDRAYTRYRQMRDSQEGQQAVLTIRRAVEGLRRLLHAGVKVCLVTNASKKAVQDWLSGEKLQDVPFVAKEDVANQKPDPEGIHAALKKMGVRISGQVWYVGDQPNDVESARRAGIRAFGVATRGQWRHLTPSKPDAIVRHAGEVADHALGKAGVFKARGRPAISATLH